MTFPEAMAVVISDDEAMTYREGWNGRKRGVMMGVKTQRPDATSANTDPYIYLFMVGTEFDKGYKRVPWTPSQEDMFSDDWKQVEVR